MQHTRKSNIKRLFLFSSLFIISAAAVIFAAFLRENTQIANPAARYCIEKGYEYAIETNPNSGDQYGVCYIPMGQGGYTFLCEEWKFYRGQCPACQEFCEYMPHIMCVGKWNITGKWPDCVCNFKCI